MKTGIYWQDPKYAVGRYSTNPSCVLYLPLHRLDGASFISKDVYGHLCTVTGALWTPRGRSFDGVDDYINLGSATAFECPSLTFLAWIKRGATGTTHCVIADTYTSSSDKDHFFQITINTSNKVTLSFGDGIIHGSKASSNTIDTEWHFIGVGRNDDTEKITFLIDSVIEDEVSYAYTCGTLVTLGNKNLQLGKTGMPSYLFPLNGLIDVAALYNRYLSPLEMLNIYLATKRRYR